jgi:hypothetical protein
MKPTYKGNLAPSLVKGKMKMSIECASCERDLRGEHAADCPYNPANKKSVDDVEKHLEVESDLTVVLSTHYGENGC